MIIPKRIVVLANEAYIAFVLMFSSGAFVSLLINPGEVSSSGSPLIRAIWSFIYFVSCVRAFRHRHYLAEVIGSNKSIVLALAIALCSSAWSIDRIETLHTSVALFLSSLFAIDMAVRYSVKKQLQLLGVVLIVEMVLSIFVEIVLPGFVPSGDAAGSAAWHGVFGFKNDFGRMICFAVVVGLALFPAKIQARVFIISFGITLAVLSRSTSAIGYTVLLTLMFLMLPILKWPLKPRKLAVVAIILVSCASIYYVSQHLVQVTAAMDKDTHLTGRVDLWDQAIESIEERPFLGYGYQAFWSADSQPARLIREETNWEDAPHAHNGYIDLTLSIGFIGLGAYLLFYCKAVRRAFVFFMDGEESYRRWPLCFLAFISVYQTTESGIFSPNNILWIIFCSLTCSLMPRYEPPRVQETDQANLRAA